LIDLEEARARLREWAYVYRDRAKRGKAASAEGRWRSPQVWETQKPRPLVVERQADATQEILQTIPVPNYRAITFRYCWPWLPLGIALRHLKRRLGYAVTLRDYEHLVILGEYAVAHALEAQRLEAEEERRQVDEMRALIQRAVRVAA